MLGTAGTIASEIFVLTGHAAGISGSGSIIAIIIGGFLSYSIALNYSELATIYPETGGALTYVREAWGKGLLSFLVGSMDCISSTFYCALSAIGFAYSLSVFIPSLPIVPVAILVIVVFTLLNIRGVSLVGNAQILLGGSLLLMFGIYIVYGFHSPTGFNVNTLFPQGRIFQSDNLWQNIAAMLKTIALIYAAYVGFEVIADDAEEIRRPDKNIPIAILVSLTLVTLIYSLTMTVTMGTLSAESLAGSETALTDAVAKFMPKGGIIMMAVAGLVATLTSVNSSMLSATREGFTLSRDGLWPRGLARLNRYRVPFVSVLFIGLVSSLITIIGLVDFLSFITSAGYLFVLFWSNLAMIRLRKKYPAIHRPFKVPLFPLTPVIASLTCLIVILFSDIKPLLFTMGVILIFTVYYYVEQGVSSWVQSQKSETLPGRSRIIVPVLDTSGEDSLIGLSAILAQSEMDINICLMSAVTDALANQPELHDQFVQTINSQRKAVLDKFIHYAVERNVPMYTKMVSGESLVHSIQEEVAIDSNTKLVLVRWPQKHVSNNFSEEAVQRLSRELKTNLGVFVDRGIKRVNTIMVPVGSGLHCQLAIHLANDIARQENAHVDYVRVLPASKDVEVLEDQMANLQEVVITELGELPSNAVLRLLFSDNVEEALLAEMNENSYSLIIIGSTDEYELNGYLFGRVADLVAESAPCNVLVVKRYQSATASWLRHQVKRLDR
jgi:amino acid transporter/nucleotide-binding universal stress UspA family protein